MRITSSHSVCTAKSSLQSSIDFPLHYEKYVKVLKISTIQSDFVGLEKVQGLRALAVPAEDLGSVSHSCSQVTNTPVPRNSYSFLWPV